MGRGLVARVIGGAIGVLLVVPAVHAAPRKQLADDKRTVVRFDDDTIQGDLTRPDGDLVWSRPRLDLPSLVAPPASFDRAAHRTLLAAADAARTQGAAVSPRSTSSSSSSRDVTPQDAAQQSPAAHDSTDLNSTDLDSTSRDSTSTDSTSTDVQRTNPG